VTDLAQAIVGRVRFIQSAGVRDDKTGSYPYGGFARDFATADGERVRIEAFTREQFADLAKTTRLARTFAFLQRVLDADFCARGGLYTHRAAIGALLAPWLPGTLSQSWLSRSQEPRCGACTFTTPPARFSPSTGVYPIPRRTSRVVSSLAG